MAKFLTGNELNLELEKILEQAEEQIVLISPYIKLHERYISSLKTKKELHKLEITIVFGKNEEDMSRSMKQEDFDFFKEFPNIEIRYEKRLHAKYYANENSAILTSMNMYSYSQDNNIEAGIMTKPTLLGSIDNFESDAWNYFSRVIDQAELLFRRTPQYESSMLGLTKKYKDSKNEVDKLSDFFSNRQKYESTIKRDFYEKKKVEQTIQNQIKDSSIGYCIRTGKQIPFNLKSPLCNEALKSWSKYGDRDYAEKFCHFSGEPSSGETSFNHPILKKNWRKAKELYGLSS